MRGEVTGRMPLLDAGGRLTAPGWAKDALWDLRGGAADPLRLKAWNRWIITDGTAAFGLEFSDAAYLGECSVWLCRKDRSSAERARRRIPVPFGSAGLGESPDASAAVSGEGWAAAVITGETGSILTVHLEKFRGSLPLDASIVLEREAGGRIAVVRPFLKEGQFYYTCKTSGIRAAGQVTVGEERILFGSDASAVQDWSRGVLPYKSLWYWGSAWGTAEGGSFGFNLGYGLGDGPEPSENAVFAGGRLHKLDRVVFRIPQKGSHEDLTGEWTAVSNDGRFKAIFRPEQLQQDRWNALVVKSTAERLFGRYTGRARLDDGRWVTFRDLPGFAERQNRQW